MTHTPPNDELKTVSLKTFRYSLPLGAIIVQWPSPLPDNEIDIIQEWFALVGRQIHREAQKIAAAELARQVGTSEVSQ